MSGGVVLTARLCQPSTLRIVIWPEASKAQNSIAAVSAEGSTVWNVFQLTRPGRFSDPLTEVLRNGARTLLGQAVEAVVAAWLRTHSDKLTNDGRRRPVRDGHLPEREILTGIGAVAVQCPRVRDRVGEGGGGIRFSSALCLRPRAR